MEDDLHVLALTKRWPHHTASGGYDRLAREVGADFVLRSPRSQSRPWSQWASHAWWKLSERSRRRRENYKYEDWLTERRLVAQVRRRSAELVHFFYGDKELPLFTHWRKLLQCPLIATFHMPTGSTARFEHLPRNFIDAALVLARCQVKDFCNWLEAERVFYVPHGIDTQRFVPRESFQPCREVTLITVGDHMRDFDSLRLIMNECNARRLPVKFELIVPEQRWSSFVGCANVRRRNHIGEDELIRAYQEADALLVPVTDTTANNAVLESLACGTPVISNAIGGMVDYVDDAGGWLFDKGEVSAIVDLIANLCSHKVDLLAYRAAARRKSLEFDWACVASQVRTVYRTVAGRNRQPTIPIA